MENVEQDMRESCMRAGALVPRSPALQMQMCDCDSLQRK